MFRRRRAVALLALVVVALTTAIGARLVLGGAGGGTLTTIGSSGATARPKVGRIYVVQPGDSLWSIVAAGGHHGDPRPAVDRLALQLGGQPLQPGERLMLP